MAIDTIIWRDGAAEIIDQRRLPGEFVKLRCETPEEMWHAIKTLAVRGAPALGGAGALGMRLAAERSEATSAGELIREEPVVGAHCAGRLVHGIGDLGFIERDQPPVPFPNLGNTPNHVRLFFWLRDFAAFFFDVASSIG